MALNFDEIGIPFTRGQTQRADDPLLTPDAPARIINGEFDDRGNLRVVDGWTIRAVSAMTGETAPPDTEQELRRLHAWKDTLLLETSEGIFRKQTDSSTPTDLFALAAGVNNRKRDSLRVRRASLTSSVEAHGSLADDWNQDRNPDAGVLGVDAAVLGNYTCVVWCEEYGTAATLKQISWLVRHKDGTVVGRGRARQNGADVKEPRVVAFSGYFHIYGITGGDLGYLRVDPTSTQNVNQLLTVIAAVGTYVWLDVALSPTQVGITCASGTVVDTYVYSQNAGTPSFVGVIGTVTPGAPTPVANFYVNTGGLGLNTAFVTFYACAGSTQTLRWFAISTAGAALGAGAQALTPVIARPVAFKDWTGNTNNIPLLIDTIGATYSTSNVELVRFDATAAAPGSMASGATTAVIVPEHFCASLPASSPGYGAYTGATNQGLLLGTYYASVAGQDTFQVFDIARAVTAALGDAQTGPNAEFSVARVFDAGRWTFNNVSLSGATVGRVCAPVVEPGQSYGILFWCAKFTPNITNVTDLGQNPTNIQRNTLRFDGPASSLEFANLLYLAGGTPLCYDGQDVFEEGFAYRPEGSAVAAGAGGPLSAGTYGIAFVYEWFDGQGNRWQSAPYPATFTAIAANTYTATVRSLRGSLKSGVQVVAYRTTAGGTIYYRDSPLGLTPLTDAAIQSSEPLYTAGQVLSLGLLSNNALPPVMTFATHQNRLFAFGGEDSSSFYYSKELSSRFPAEFNRASGRGYTPSECGDVVAGGTLDDKLALFGTNQLAVMFGIGPNRLWAQNGYSVPSALQTTEGIREDTPFIALAPEGIWYQTELGPRLLGRNLATALYDDGLPIGADLVTGAKAPVGKCEVVMSHPKKAQVLFCSAASNACYIFDSNRKQWTTRDDLYILYALRHAAGVRGLFWFVKDTGLLTGFAFEDVSSEVSLTLTVETGWVSFAGLQRFQRLSRLQLIALEREKGIYASTYEFRLKVYADYNSNTPTQDTTIEVAPLNKLSAPFKCEIQLVQQKSTAYKFVLTLRPPVSSEGGNFALASMLAKVGLKQGGGKFPAIQRA
jgi:hypothetical protein